MRARRAVAPEDIKAIRDLAQAGLTANEIGPKVDRDPEVVRNIAKANGIQLSLTLRIRGKSSQTPGSSPPPTQEELRQIHLAGPPMGRCRECGTWRPLSGHRVKAHPHGERQCPGSNTFALSNHNDD